MSNHLHLIVSALEGFELSGIIRDFKKFTLAEIIRSIESNTGESRRNWMLWMFKSAAKKNSKNVHYQFWQRNFQPKQLESNKFMEEKLNYIHQNPVAAGLVDRAEDYNYSSARNYEGEEGYLEVEFLE